MAKKDYWTLYHELAKLCLVEWNGMSEKEASKQAEQYTNWEQLDNNCVWGRASVEAFCKGLSYYGGLSSPQDLFMLMITPKAQLDSNPLVKRIKMSFKQKVKDSKDLYKLIRPCLNAVHDTWIRGNVKKLADPNRTKSMYMFVPFEYFTTARKWDDVYSKAMADYIFGKPLIEYLSDKYEGTEQFRDYFKADVKKFNSGTEMRSIIKQYWTNLIGGTSSQMIGFLDNNDGWTTILQGLGYDNAKKLGAEALKGKDDRSKVQSGINGKAIAVNKSDIVRKGEVTNMTEFLTSQAESLDKLIEKAVNDEEGHNCYVNTSHGNLGFTMTAVDENQLKLFDTYVDSNLVDEVHKLNLINAYCMKREQTLIYFFFYMAGETPNILCVYAADEQEGGFFSDFSDKVLKESVPIQMKNPVPIMSELLLKVTTGTNLEINSQLNRIKFNKRGVASVDNNIQHLKNQAQALDELISTAKDNSEGNNCYVNTYSEGNLGFSLTKASEYQLQLFDENVDSSLVSTIHTLKITDAYCMEREHTLIYFFFYIVDNLSSIMCVYAADENEGGFYSNLGPDKVKRDSIPKEMKNPLPIMSELLYDVAGKNLGINGRLNRIKFNK